MTLEKQEYLSYPGLEINEDLVTIKDNAAWVLDGATGLSKANWTDEPSDALWYVKQWDAYLQKTIANHSLTLMEIMEGGFKQIKAAYQEFVKDRAIEAIDMPSAGIALVRWQGSILEYFTLGDCSILLRLDDAKFDKEKARRDQIRLIKDHTLEALDGIVIQKISDYMSQDPHIKHRDARNLFKEDLIKHRLLQNTENGYWILGFDPSAVHHSQNGKLNFNLNNVKVKVLLCSDGFSALYDRYDLYAMNDLFLEIDLEGLESIYKKLRLVEGEDPECIKYPRLKVHDDASAVYLSDTQI